MWLNKLLLILGCFLAKTEAKSSLTFVIDSTSSMGDDIDQVKSNTNLVFDTVFHSNESQIDDFIIVTFNDPGSKSKVLTITKDRATFKRVLASILVNGGGDCPEFSMSGIEMALEVSQPSSYIYVFTDATAKDYGKLANVQNMAINMQSQIVFLLTGDCGMSKSRPEYAAYYTLSKATDGEVFHMAKSNVGEVLNYISETIESVKTKVVVKSLPPGHHEVKFPVDDTMKDATIVLNGDNKKKVKLAVFKPNGTEAETKTILDLPTSKVLKIKDPETGNYTAEVDSKGESTLFVTAKTSFDFRHRFSPVLSPSLDAMSIRPKAGANSFIMIQLETPDDDIKLKTIDIVDLENNLIMTFNAQVLDKKRKIYFAPRFVPPNNQFKIAIKAQNSRSGEVLRRNSKPLEPQKPELVKTIPKDPTVQILEGPKLVISYDEPLVLTCKVKGYPQPTVTWEHVESGRENSSIFSVIEPPYDYLSTLRNTVARNGTYRCKAKINGVEATANVGVTLKNTFEVVEIPKANYDIPYDQNGRVHGLFSVPCGVKAYPPATITWYFKDKVIKRRTPRIVNFDSLTFKIMLPYMQGVYSCEIRNNFHTNVTHFNIRLTGFEPPVIDKTISKVNVLEGSDAKITCKLLAGKPKPSIILTEFHAGLERYNNETNDYNTTITLPHVNKDQSGNVKCEAKNDAGFDQHYIKLNVGFPPTIRKDAERVILKEGASKTLYCSSEGNPKPHVKWTLNGSIIVSDGRLRHIYRDNSLKIQPSTENHGNYTCQAQNVHGTDRKTIEVVYSLPASIEIPERSTINSSVGRDITLECHAGGFPAPTTVWTFISEDPAVKPKVFMVDSSGSLALRNVQPNDDGFYTCNATNIGGGTNITYQVNVYSPPKIVSVDKIYRAVEEDLVLRIPCKAKGNPIPIIIWSYLGFNIPKGTDFYDIEEDGTLVIKNVDVKSRGIHLCTATNYLGQDNYSAYVDVSRSPHEEAPTTSVVLKEGDRAVLNCPLPHKIGSRLRWYKNEKLLSKGDLIIDKAKVEDSGVYTCRVSTFAGADSSSVEVTVTSAPEFQNKPKTNIEFEEKLDVELDCSNYAEPAAKTKWYFNKKLLYTDNDTYYFEMQYSNIGEYTCIVSNGMGSINRTFIIKSTDCALHMQNDFTGNMPLMSISYEPSVKTVGDNMYIPKNQALELSCPRGFTSTPKSKITATCLKDTVFSVNKEVYEFKDLKCVSKKQPDIVRTGFRCSHEYSEILRVGFMTDGTFSHVYDVCVDRRNNMPIFTKLMLRRILSDLSPKDPEWFNSTYVPFNFGDMYDCEKQNLETSRALNRRFHEKDSCCFGNRQLVNAKDVIPGLSRVATYSNLNLVSQWSSCNTENWDNLEGRIRSLAKMAGTNLWLWSGQAHRLSLRDSLGHDINVTISDGSKQQPVPKYLWKVLQEPLAWTSLAIIQINVPDLTPEEARGHVLCPDVCGRISWMNGRNWRDVTKGYTYCCEIREFVKAFGFKNTFNRGGASLLTNIASISTSSLVT